MRKSNGHNQEICGIDYSMTGPAMCVHRGKTWSFDNCKFYYLTDKKKFLKPNSKFFGQIHLPYSTQEERFYNIAQYFIKNIPTNSKFAWIEAYSYASTGLTFQIGENTGQLKYTLWTNNIQHIAIPPQTVKKFATGKGTSKKEEMYNSFLLETKFDLSTFMGANPAKSPVSDIVDSYYIAKFGFDSVNNPEI